MPFRWNKRVRWNHEEAHARQPSAQRRAAARQPAGRRAYLPERQVRIRDGRRDAEDAARRIAGLLLHAREQPDHAPARAHARGAAGARRLPRDRVGSQRHRADADRADEAGRSRVVLHRDLRADTQHHPPPAGAVRRRQHDVVDRRPGRHRERARHASDAPGVVREPDQSGDQGRGHRAASSSSRTNTTRWR